MSHPVKAGKSPYKRLRAFLWWGVYAVGVFILINLVWDQFA